MISLAEIRREAAKLGVDVAIIEKDYVLSWVLRGVCTSPLTNSLVFKGGTALRKVYFSDYRFSEDLDFTINKPLTIDTIESSLSQVCREISTESGLELTVADLKQTNTAVGRETFEGKIAYVGPRQHRGNPGRIKLDLTAYEKIILPPAGSSLLHGYSDRCSVTISSYQLDEILAEKIRTIIQRGYPRDLYDVWYILKFHRDKIDYDSVRTTYLQKCEFKNVRPVEWKEFFESAAILSKETAFANSLGRQLKELPGFAELTTDLARLLGDLAAPA